MRPTFFSLIFGILILAGCQEPIVEGQEPLQGKSFFDLSAYFAQEIESLTQQTEVKKSVSINGQEEEKVIKKPDFSQELSVFIKSDINRTAWIDKYQVDSIFNEQKELTQLTYSALEEKLRTRKVEIFFNKKQVKKVNIVNTTTNIIAQTEQILTYLPKKSYSIRSIQNVLFSTSRILEVNVNFNS